MFESKEEKWKKLISEMARNSLNTLCFLITILVTYMAEEIFRKSFFRCPCTQYTMYGLAMVACPSLFLLGLGLITSSGFWRTVLKLNKMQNAGLKCNHCMKSLSVIFRPFLPMISFIVVALMRGDYYICGQAGPNGCKPAGDTAGSGLQHTRESRLKMHMQSQILGAGVLLGALVFSVGIVSVRRCFFNRQLPDLNDLAAMEKEILYQAFGEKLEKLVKDEVTKKVDGAFNTNNEEEDIEQVFYRAKEKLLKKGNDEGSSQFMGLLRQIQLVDDNEGTHLGMFEAQSMS